MIRRLPKPVKRFMVQYTMAADLLWQYGERATPKNVKFVWSTINPDWQALQSNPAWRWGNLV